MPSKKLNPKLKPDTLPEPAHEWSFEAIGTKWWIGLYEAYDATRFAILQNSVWDRIESFDRVYSRFRPDSLVTQISQQAGKYIFPPDASRIFDLYRQLYDLSGGLVTPLVGNLLADAGYDANYSLQTKALHAPALWDDAMHWDGNVLATRRPVLLDFGAAGKGYLVDLVAGEMQKAGVTKYCVDAGGDMVCYGLGAPLKVGLEHPDDITRVIGVAELQNGALCGSAGNRRAWGDFTHIMNPKSLQSPRHLKAVWVCADNALTADALTTALYFTDVDHLHTQFQFEHCIMYADESMSVSPGFPAQFFTE